MLDGIVGMTFHTLFITPLTIENVPFFSTTALVVIVNFILFVALETGMNTLQLLLFIIYLLSGLMTLAACVICS